MINTFKIGDKVLYNGFTGIVVSNIVQIDLPTGVALCYLVEFDKKDNLELRFECKEIDYSSRVGAINQNFLTKII
jgi:hypothetical protein